MNGPFQNQLPYAKLGYAAKRKSFTWNVTQWDGTEQYCINHGFIKLLTLSKNGKYNRS